MPAAILPGAEPFSFEAGTDVGVLLLHGFTGCPQSLRPWGEALRDGGVSVDCPLLPGHGTSWKNLARVHQKAWVDAAASGLDRVAGRCRQVLVCSLSFGGAIALRLAQLHPDTVRGLVLVNPYLYSSDRRFALLPVLKWVAPSLPGVGSDIADPAAHELAYDRVPLRALDQARRLQRAVVEQLPQVRQPLLVYCSRQDHVVERGNAQLVTEKVGSERTELVWLERSYHVATLDYDKDTIFEGSLRFAREMAGS